MSLLPPDGTKQTDLINSVQLTMFGDGLNHVAFDKMKDTYKRWKENPPNRAEWEATIAHISWKTIVEAAHFLETIRPK